MAPLNRSVDTFERIFGHGHGSGECSTDATSDLLPSARSPRSAWGEVTVAELLDRSLSPAAGTRSGASCSRERHYRYRTPTPAMPPGGKETIGSMIRCEDRKTLPASVSTNPQFRPIFRPVRRFGTCRPTDSDVETIETDMGKGRRKYPPPEGSKLRPQDWALRSRSSRGLGRRQSPEVSAAARNHPDSSKPTITAEVAAKDEDPLVQTVGLPGAFHKLVSVGSRRHLTQESTISFEELGGDERPSSSPCPTGRSLNASSSTSSSLFFQRRTGLEPPVRSWSPVTRSRPTWSKDDRVGRPAPPPYADPSASVDGSIELCDQLSLPAYRFHQRELNYSWNMHSARTRWRR
mmetsp:Transcript_69847/g.130507  ORF Transcript_69847/g.130507 Transcript_69847/m.130507 type:complete len:349 (-) Transcript_69847:188-1234(-)